MAAIMTRLRRRLAAAPSEAGFGLPELIVSMLIFAVLLAIVGESVLAMTKALNKTSALAAAADQNRVAFDHFEKELRSATNVNRPVVVADTVAGHTGNEMYLEFQNLDANAIPTCHQWRYVSFTHELQERHWLASAPAPSGATGFTTVASGLYNTIPAGNYTSGRQSVFFFTPQGGTFPSASDPGLPNDAAYVGPLSKQVSQFEAITVTLISRRGTHPSAQAITQSSVLALNTAPDPVTSVSVQTNNDSNGDFVTDNPVCSGARP